MAQALDLPGHLSVPPTYDMGITQLCFRQSSRSETEMMLVKFIAGYLALKKSSAFVLV